MNLRDYQTRAVEIVLEKLKQGIDKQVLVLATGLGKTVIFSNIISQLVRKTGKKALILAHREELLTQAKDKLERIDPTLSIGIEMADQKVDPSCDVVVASVATLGRTNSERIKKFDPTDFCCVVVDEAHHASASTYKNVFKHFGILKPDIVLPSLDLAQIDNWNKECLLLGVTATPSRNDNEGIDKIFDEVVFNYGIIEGIQNGWLSRIRAYRVDTTTSLENVHTRVGDFAQDELADAINNPERNSLIVKTYLEQFKDKQALVFAIDVAHAEALQKAFVDKSVTTAIVTGDTPKFVRHTNLELFHNKQINVVVNCMVLTEGYDNDTIDAIFMARPTKSGILYSQMVGRGTRTHHEKPWLTVVDFVDNTYRHTIKTSASLIGVQGMVNFQGGDILEGLEAIDKIREVAPDFNLDRLDFAKLDYIMEEVDLMGGLDIPTDLKGTTDHSWYRYGENAYKIGLGNYRYLVIQESLTGQWKVTEEEWVQLTKSLTVEELGEMPNLEDAVRRADQYIVNNYPDSLYLVNMQAKWRKDPPTDAQKTQLRRLGVSHLIIEQLNKGQASQLQSKLYTSRPRKI